MVARWSITAGQARTSCRGAGAWPAVSRSAARRRCGSLGGFPRALSTLRRAWQSGLVSRRVRPVSSEFAQRFFVELRLLMHRAAQGMRTQCTYQRLRAELRRVCLRNCPRHLARMWDRSAKDHRAGLAGRSQRRGSARVPRHRREFVLWAGPRCQGYLQLLSSIVDEDDVSSAPLAPDG